MRKQIIAFAIVLGLFFPAAHVNAQTYDLSNYFLTTSGSYKIAVESSTCRVGTWETGTTVSDFGRYFLHTEYDIQEKDWIEKQIVIFELTPSALVYYGNFDLRDAILWRLQPAVVIPRSLRLNHPVSNSGVVTNGLVSSPYVLNIMIVEAGVSVTTSGGVFNGCLKILTTEMNGPDSGSYAEIWAPGLGMVQRTGGSVNGGETVPSADASEGEVIEYFLP